MLPLLLIPNFLISSQSARAACGDEIGALSTIARIGEFTENSILKPAATLVLSSRCKDHLTQSSLLRSKDCDEGAARLIADLDCPGMKGLPCFVTEFRELMRSNEVMRYLSALALELQKLDSDPNASFDLWNWTLDFCQGDRDKALKWIAVLFQAGNFPEVLAYFENRGERDLPNARLYVEALNILIRMIPRKSQVLLYPKQGMPSRPGLYHFYVPAYLASRLKSKFPGERGEKLASFLPALFNASFEYAYVNSSKRKKSEELFNRLTMYYDKTKEPKFLDLTDPMQQHVTEASYLGYASAIWAVDPTRDPLDIDGFRDAFAASPRRFFQGIISK